MKRSELIKMVAKTNKTICLLKVDGKYITHYASEYGREKKAIFSVYEVAKERADELSERLGKTVTVEVISV